MPNDESPTLPGNGPPEEPEYDTERERARRGYYDPPLEEPSTKKGQVMPSECREIEPHGQPGVLSQPRPAGSLRERLSGAPVEPEGRDSVTNAQGPPEVERVAKVQERAVRRLHRLEKPNIGPEPGSSWAAHYQTWRGRRALRAWLKRHAGNLWYEQIGSRGLEDVSLSATKPTALLYIDDRAWRFTGANWPTVNDVRAARPWHKERQQ